MHTYRSSDPCAVWHPDRSMIICKLHWSPVICDTQAEDIPKICIAPASKFYKIYQNYSQMIRGRSYDMGCSDILEHFK